MNTDFPNDYVAARLVREGYTVDRIYEWEWFEEQKERMHIVQPMAGFIPHTPFSVIPMLPFTWLEPLPAKRAWILCSLALLAFSVSVLSRLARISWRWVLAAACLSLPLYRNLEYGQYYILLLALLIAALWADAGGYRFLAGLILAFAAGLKIFPVVIVLLFVRKRDYRALTGFGFGAAIVVFLSLAAFGGPASIRFIQEILPAAMSGEAMNPFALQANSFSALIHHLFVYEPTMNPHPAFNAPALIGFLEPLLQMLVLVPAVLLCSRERDPERDPLECCLLLIAALTISTLPASYNFIVLLLPCSIFFGYLVRGRRWKSATLCAVGYFLAGWILSTGRNTDGWRATVGVPRLWALLALLVLFYGTLYRPHRFRLRKEAGWAIAMSALCFVQMFRLSKHEQHLYDSHHFLQTTGCEMFVKASLRREVDGIAFHGMTSSGWRWAVLDQQQRIHVERPTKEDSFVLVEEAGRHSLQFHASMKPGVELVSAHALDVYEFSLVDQRTVVFSAMGADGVLELYRVSLGGSIEPLGIENARFPAISPDRRWIAYSTLVRGNWRLVVQDHLSGKKQFAATAECNDAFPVWDDDSRGLTYVSDCGRGLWQTEFARLTLPH